LVKPGVISGFRSLKEALEKRLNEQLTKSKKNMQQHNRYRMFINSDIRGTTSKKLSLSEHKEYVLKLIKRWCSENRENLNLYNFNLEENVDFTLNIDLDKNQDVNASIKCKCSKLISLAKNDSKIQVSNYYKHLLSKGCDHMRDLKKAAKVLRAATINVYSINIYCTNSCISSIFTINTNLCCLTIDCTNHVS
jgi:hypothetical protein